MSKAFILGGAQVSNTLHFWVDHGCTERLNLGKSAGHMIALPTFIISGALWPISLPIMINLENKWKHT